jgi:hypothetical protein
MVAEISSLDSIETGKNPGSMLLALNGSQPLVKNIGGNDFVFHG